MKKLLFLFLLISAVANAQWATPERLPRTTVVNTGTFYGKGAGTVNAPIQMIVAPGSEIDTASWRFVSSGGDGSNKVMVNRVTYLGRAAGTVYATLVYPVNSATEFDPDENHDFAGNQTFDTVTAETILPVTHDISTIGETGNQFLNIHSRLFYQNGSEISTIYSALATSNTFSGTSNSFTGKVRIGTGTSNGTADFLVMGDTTTIRGTALRDSSYLRVEVNPFSQRLKVSVIGKTGNNMLTVDSTLMSTSLAFTTGGVITSGHDVAVVNSRYFILGSNLSGTQGALFRSTAEGVISLTNAGGTGFTTFTVGAGNLKAGFFRGTTDTDITGWFAHSPDGTLYYIYPTNGGLTLTISPTIP